LHCHDVFPFSFNKRPGEFPVSFESHRDSDCHLLRRNNPHIVAMQCFAMLCVALPCPALGGKPSGKPSLAYRITFQYPAIHCVAVRCFALTFIASLLVKNPPVKAETLTALLSVALRCLNLRCTAVPCSAFDGKPTGKGLLPYRFAFQCPTVRCSALICFAMLCRWWKTHR
jgi:hypothetical protein